VKHGDDRKGDAGGDGVRARGCEAAEKTECWLNQTCKGRFADPAKPKRRDRHAELRRGKIGIEIVDGALQHPSPGLTLGHKLFDPAAAHTDEGEFGCDEEAVGGNQPKHGKQLAKNKGKALVHYLTVGCTLGARASR